MRNRIRPFVISALLGLAALAASAQTSDEARDRDYLTALLEDNLSGAGRQVVIEGFAGALSSRATMQSMTIADDAGVWMTLKDVTLDWQRSDLLLGRLTVNSLSAGEIDLARMPSAEDEITAEVTPFALPELPVAISIGSLSVDALHLAAPILGQEVIASATATLTLAAGEGQGQITLTRSDEHAPTGRAALSASFANATRTLSIDLDAREGAGGILAQLLGIPNAPALELVTKGDGPLSDFAAQIDLRSDDTSRLVGRLRLGTALAETDKAIGTFNLDVSGDLAPLMQPDYRAFFGTQSTLRAAGETRAGGGIDVRSLDLTTQAMQFSGAMVLTASGLPERFSLQGTIGAADGRPLILPLGLDLPAAITHGQINAHFDAAQSDEWQASASLIGWAQDDLRINRSEVSAKGILALGKAAAFDADITYSAEGVQPARVSLARALGSVIWGQGRLASDGAGPLRLQGFSLQGENYALGLDGTLSGVTSGLNFAGQITASADDLARFSDLLGRPMAGAAKASFAGDYALLTGGFDADVSARAQDLALGIPKLDAMLQGASQINVSAARGTGGIDLRAFSVRARGGSADLAGKIATKNASLNGTFSLADLPMTDRGFGGTIRGDMAMTGGLNDALVSLNAQAKGLVLPFAQANAVLGPQTEVTAKLRLVRFAVQDLDASLTSSQLTLHIAQKGAQNGVEISAGLANLGVVLPEFPGALTLSGRAQTAADGAILDVSVQGPAALNARISGTVSTGQSNDLTVTGRADAGLINAFIAPRSLSGAVSFDLGLRGAPSLTNLQGSIALTGGQMADPSLPFSLKQIAAQGQMTGGTMTLSVQTQASTGGTITAQGTLGTAPPYAANLAIALRDLGLRSSDFYDSSVSGDLALSGPVLGGARLVGAIELGRTEVQLRPTSLNSLTSLPGLRHIGDSAAVRQTRARAGLLAIEKAASNAPPIDLDITVRADNRLFVRGRGLDAELGGELRLLGSTANVRPSGAFDLVQGRFELLGKRLDLEEVRLELQGELIPYLSLRAVNVKGAVTTTVIIDGPAIDPDFRFSASPEMPEEEILAQLLFDQNLAGLSPLQAVQLAGAIATLAGKGDGLQANIRKRLALDNLDLQTTEEGTAALTAGKYVSKNTYTELSVESAGKQKIDFSYDLNSKIKLRAGVSSTGSVGAGIEFETNY